MLFVILKTSFTGVFVCKTRNLTHVGLLLHCLMGKFVAGYEQTFGTHTNRVQRNECVR
jgi:hypothetical protein